jgi:hypothetical protein
VTSPKFEPRNFCEDPELFGKYEPIEWRAVGVGAADRLDQLAAARIQHTAALDMLRKIHSNPEFRTVKRYAESIGADPTRVGRLLRGSIVMRIEDLVSAERNLGMRVFRRAQDAAEPAT